MENETYARFGIGGNTIAQGGPITPLPDRPQHGLVLIRAGAIEDEGAVHMPIGANDEADAHRLVIVFRRQQRVGSKQRFWRTNISAFWQC